MVTYNLINSVKGGCGKTTLSIWLAYYLNMLSEENYQIAKDKVTKAIELERIAKENKNIDELNKAVIEKEKCSKELEKCQAELDTTVLIDMDLLGTSMQVIFGVNSSKEKIAVTNDIFQGVKNSKKQFIQKIKLKNTRCINIIFSSMDYLEREKFKSGRYRGYAPAVKHGIFRSGLRELIQCNKTIEGKNVQHFIFDMPPNSDGFSDAAMECIMNKKYSVLDKGDRKNLFMMIGSEWGQTIATIEELKIMFIKSDEILPDRIFLVINHNLRGDFQENCYKIRKEKIEAVLDEMLLKEEEKKKIFFLKMYNSEKYTELGIGAEKGGMGLKNAEANIVNDAIPKAVIKAVASYGGDFEEVVAENNGQRKLQQLILGEENE